MILLGAGESGKSTVLKQMRLIHTAGFGTVERKQWRVTIFSNLLNAFQCIQGCMDEHDVDFEDKQNLVCSRTNIGAGSQEMLTT